MVLAKSRLRRPLLIKGLLIALPETFSESFDHRYSNVLIDVDRLQLGGHYQPKATTHQAPRIPLAPHKKHTLVARFQLRFDGQLTEDI